MREEKNIWVYAHWEGFHPPLLMGILSAVPAKGKEVFSFEYTKEWLKTDFTFLIDPDLQMYPGRYFPRGDKANFGAFLDSCPDRWGRVLMDRREALMARKEGRSIINLVESDYLLGVFDGHRMGALRFKTSPDGDFLNNDTHMSTPPFASLRQLEEASLRFEEETGNDEENLKWINLLIAPGSSLGGARPKASVIDSKGRLWIAKFPSLNDKKDIGAWEMASNSMASEAGLKVAQSSIKKFNSKNHTYLSMRFDRTEKGERTHFASAMTLLGYTDGAGSDIGVSYLEIAEFIMRHGSDVNEDLEELWRRIVFSICIKNTDDHLRNHGFLLTQKGWKLAPAYDINPNEFGTGLSLNISEKDNSLDIELAMSVSSYFRLNEHKAHGIVNQIRDVVKRWRDFAKMYGIGKVEQDKLSKAFEPK
jgi:serine/threonine-protein kinase HipA